MAIIEELIRAEQDGGISFGNYTLAEKAKKSDVEITGNLYKIKTYRDITRLERNETVLYESVPGTAVSGMCFKEGGISFSVEGDRDAQITLGLADDTTYDITINGVDAGTFRTTMGGKLAFSVSLSGGVPATVTVTEQD